MGLPCGLAACKAVSVTQLREMEREDHAGLGKVEERSKKKINEDPLPFLRKPSSTRPPPSIYGSEVDIQPTRNRQTPSGLMGRIFQQ